MSTHDYREHHSYDNDAPETPTNPHGCRIVPTVCDGTFTGYNVECFTCGTISRSADVADARHVAGRHSDPRRLKRAAERTKIVADAKAKEEAYRQARIADRRGVIGY
jgi:hypothetical protein